MAEFVQAGVTDELPPGSSKVVVHQGIPVVVFNVDGAYFAVSNVCPHAGGRLDEGFIENERIVCRWHGWSFPLSPKDPPNDGLLRYRVVVDEGVVLVEFPALPEDKGWR